MKKLDIFPTKEELETIQRELETGKDTEALEFQLVYYVKKIADTEKQIEICLSYCQDHEIDISKELESAKYSASA